MTKTIALPKKLLARPDGKINWTPDMESCLREFMAAHAEAWNKEMNREQGFEKNHGILKANWVWNQEVGSRLQLMKWHPDEAVAAVFAQIELLWLAHGRIHENLLKVTLNIQTEAAIDFLLSHPEELAFRNALTRQARRWPLYILKKLLDLNPSRTQPAATLFLELLAANPDWQAPLEADCSEAQQKTLARLTRTEQVAEAAMEDLPAFIRNPPWQNPQALPRIPVLGLELPAEEATIHWTPEATAKAALEPDFAGSFARYHQSLMGKLLPDCRQGLAWKVSYVALYLAGGKPERLERILADGTASADDFEKSSYLCLFNVPPYVVLPDNLAEILFRFADMPYGRDESMLLQVLGRFGVRAVPWLLRAVREAKSAHLPAAVEMIETADLAAPLAWSACRNKWAKERARRWLRRYPETAARGLIPYAFGGVSPYREPARQMLRWLADQGAEWALRQEAERYGQPAREALALLLSIAPEGVLPDKLPALPAKLYLPGLPRLVLQTDGRAIPLAVLPDILMNLMLSTADDPYPGLAKLQEVVTPDSLARLGQALLDWWQTNGAPGKERWIFDVQGIVGNDETARQLTVALRQWRGAQIRLRAYEALNLLAQIGSDGALMYLHGISQQTRYADIQQRAAALLANVAEARGLSREQLADRTVPDLGLGADGKLGLDFGPRQFTVALDEALVPYVKDSQGKRLKDLPKPNGKDDESLSRAAVARYKELKKQVKSIAAAQLKRLESAMVTQRRWSAEEFDLLFVRHPLTGQLARRLIWGVYDGDGHLLGVCRIAEDLTLADGNDDTYQLPGSARLGIVHPLELPAKLRQAFGQVLADYQILQPFPQIGRETYALRPEDREISTLPEWMGRKVTNGSLLGLEQRGWDRVVGDNGMIYTFTKALASGLAVSIYVDDGWFVGEPPESKAVQEIREVRLAINGHWGQLDAIAFSELQRDLHLMAWFEE